MLSVAKISEKEFSFPIEPKNKNLDVLASIEIIPNERSANQQNSEYDLMNRLIQNIPEVEDNLIRNEVQRFLYNQQKNHILDHLSRTRRYKKRFIRIIK